MGTTCTSLHVLRPGPLLGTQAAPITRPLTAAFKAIGYVLEKNPTADSAQRLVVTGVSASRFMSIYDRDADLVNPAALIDVAVALSKRLKTVAIVTTVFDSDWFQLMVFNQGKQVDAILSDPDAGSGPLKVLSVKKRLPTWSNLFLMPAVLEDFAVRGATLSDTERMALLVERQRDFEAKFERAVRVAGPIAEEGLAAWCDVAGVSVEAALASGTEPIDEVADAEVLIFRKLPSQESQAHADDAPRVAATGIQWAPLQSHDHCPHLRPYPAASPIEPDQPSRHQWLVLMSAGGLSGLKLSVAMDDPAAVRISKIELYARHFYNGQLTPAGPIADFQHVVRTTPTGAVVEIEAAPFDVPTLDPETRKQVLLILVLEVVPTGTQAFTLRPALIAQSPMVEMLALPPAKLQPRTVTWSPLLSAGATKPMSDALLRLNEPAVVSMVAVLNDDGGPVRARIRELVETWLSALSPPAGTQVHIQTQKHMSPVSFRVSKASKSIALDALRADKLWPKLFDPAADYHTVTFGLQPPEAPQIVAGLTLQAALRDSAERAASLPDALAPYLQGGAPVVVSAPGAGETLAVGLWVLNHADAFTQLGSSSGQVTATFEAWIDSVAPLQGWIAQTAWFPAFDLYEEFRQTAYEQVSSIDWFRSGLNGLLASKAWSSRRLRFVAPVMWLGPDLMTAVDRDALARVADVTQGQTAARIALRPRATLADLEAALRPILPMLP